MNVASVEPALVSLNVPVLPAGPLIALPSLAPPSELGAFLALFTGFVGKNESAPLFRSADRQAAKAPDHEKDKSATKDSVTTAVTIAPAQAPQVLDLPQVLVEPSVSRNLPISSPTDQQPGAPVADHSNAVQIASPNPLEPQIAFALQLTPVTPPPVPATAPDASLPVEPKQRSEVGVERPQSPSVQSEPVPLVQHDIRVAAVSSPAQSESQASKQQQPADIANDPKDNRATAQQSPKESTPVSRPQPVVYSSAGNNQDAQSVRPSVLIGIPDQPVATPEVKAPASERTTPTSSPAAQLPASHSAATEVQSEQDAKPDQTGGSLPSNPASERVVLPRVQQRSTQQEAGNGQSGSRESKAQTADRRDESTDRNQSRIQKNPIAFEPRSQTAGDTKTTAIGSSGPAVNSREATIIAPEIETKAIVQPQPARQISLKLAGPDSKQVDVQLMERAGRVQVSVRTADRQLAKSLQGDLGDLVGRLENKGFKTEAWIPASRHAVAAVFEPASTANGRGRQEHSGSGTGQQQERQGRHGSNQRQQPRWAAQLDETLSAEETRKETE